MLRIGIIRKYASYVYEKSYDYLYGRMIMITRRSFLDGVLYATPLLALGGTRVVAAADQSYAGIVYSREHPGKWGTKVESHVPLVTVEGRKVTVTTAHPMSQDHYIVRHTLVLENGTVAGEKTYFPAQDSKAAATFEIPSGYKGKCSATSFCNLHDLWVTEINL